MKDSIQRAYEYLGSTYFFRGRLYQYDYVEYVKENRKDKKREFLFNVISKIDYNDLYNIKITTQNGEIVSSNCNCPEYKSRHVCDHIAACLYHYRDEIFSLTKEEVVQLVSKSILNRYANSPKSKYKVKKQVNLAIELDFDYEDNDVSLNIKIGEERLYLLNNKLGTFLDIYSKNEGQLSFGKNFTYDPSIHFFSKEDEDVIKYVQKYLQRYRKLGYYGNERYIYLDSDELETFLELLYGKSFSITGVGNIKSIQRSLPIELNLSKVEDGYRLSYHSDTKMSVLMSNYKYVASAQVLYIVPQKQNEILSIMNAYNLNELVFEEKDVSNFTKSILPIFKDNVEVDEDLKDKIVIGTKPEAKIYLDLKGNLIICKIKLSYGDKEIGFFDTEEGIVRDQESEDEVLGTILGYGFELDKKKIYMTDADTIGAFLEEGIENLTTKYEVYTSTKLKDTNVLRDSHIRSSFSIGQDNIMSYSFDLGDISNDEIVNVLSSLKSKKKYYRLKNGDFLNLDQNDELKELESLIEDMELSDRDLQNGSGEIPKYRAIYLDCVKKEKYNIIETDNLFDELIQNFNSYKNIKIKLSASDREILRDYQQVGVKWLYNIYKCGFGGILADEMGLGKSIQLIYFIKQILKEKPDSKILIVAPTSLVYNWTNEFNKFGSELKYKEFAENKATRMQDLENLGDTNILITTYGLLRRDQEIYKEIQFELVAIDEAQNIKNPNAQMTKVAKQLKAKCKVALTGTPLENSVIELWSIFDFIMPGYLANVLAFNKKYNIKDVDEENLSSLDNLNRQISPFILRRKKKDVVKELPEKLENNIFIELNPEQKKLYVAQLEKTQKELEEILKTDGFKKGNFKILQLLMKLRQLCIDPRIIYEDYTGGSAKIENMIEITKGIIENNHKILVFTSFKTALDILNREFTNNNISTYVIDGSVSSKKRMELVEKFNNDDTNVFLITLKSGGTGLNLTSADVVIHLDLWWNPQVENQATDRAHRIGQKNTVEVIKLITKGTIEERILELQNKKKVLSDKLIEGEDRDKNVISKLSEDDVKRLLSLDLEDSNQESKSDLVV